MLTRVSGKTLRRIKDRKLKRLKEIYKEGEKPKKRGRPRGSKANTSRNN